MKSTVISFLIIIFPVIKGNLTINIRDEHVSLNCREKDAYFGGKLQSNIDERLVNTILKSHKSKEIYEVLDRPHDFPPVKNFLLARSDIEKSEVFKIIKKMPKGAALHIHDIGFVSDDWIFDNVTYRDNLYVCDDYDILILRFSINNNISGCNWQLLSELRMDEKRAADINAKIRRELSMVTSNPSKIYRNTKVAREKLLRIEILLYSFLMYKPVFEDYFYQGLNELYEDNVFYAEFRTSLNPLYDLHGNIYGPDEIMKIYQRILDRFTTEHDDFLGAKFIYTPLVIGNQLEIEVNQTLKLKNHYPSLIAGFDIRKLQNSDRIIENNEGPILGVLDKLKFFFHAGETNWYGSVSDDNIISAILYNTTRIGHGYTIVKHSKILKMIKDQNIAIEICPISNQVLKLVDDLRNHPASILFANNYPIVISNDTPGLWGSKALSYDFYEAFMGMMPKQAGIMALKQLALNSINYSAMDNDMKSDAVAFWLNKWREFLDDLIFDNFESIIYSYN